MNWIIGDVHGMLRELNAVLEEIKRQDADAHFWFVGDYCDRGPDSKGVVDVLIGLGDRFHGVRGNHDDVFDTILGLGPTRFADPRSTSTGADAACEALDWFWHQGMQETLASYGIGREEVRRYLGPKTIHLMLSDIPQEHKDFYHNLPIYLDGPGFFVTHAYVPPSASGPEEIIDNPVMLLWSRFDESLVSAEKSWAKTGYFGHTPTKYYKSKRVVRGPKIRLLDTGCVFPDCGILSAVCHETQMVVECERGESAAYATPYDLLD